MKFVSTSLTIADATDDEKAALRWMSQRIDHRLKWFMWLSLPINLVLASMLGISSSHPTSLVEILSVFLLFSTVTTGILSPIATLLPIGNRGFRVCRRMIESFTRLDANEVLKSSLSQPVRNLHHVVMKNFSNMEREKAVRMLMRKSGPDAALKFMRLCQAFAPLKGSLENADVVPDAEIDRSATEILTLCSQAPAPARRKFHLTMPGMAALDTSGNAVAQITVGDGGVFASLQGSGIAHIASPSPLDACSGHEAVEHTDKLR